MNKIENSKIMLILSILLMFLVIGAATAADDTISNETVSTSTDDVDTLNTDSVSVDEEVSAAETTDLVANDANNNLNNLLSSEPNSGNDILKDTSENASTFTQLNELIRLSTGRLLLYNDYKYDSSSDQSLLNGITLSKKIEIDGQNHIIDANKVAKFFTINQDNVVLKNIKFINFKNTAGIEILGNNVTLDNVDFCNSTSLTKDLLVVYGSNCTMSNSNIYNIKVNKQTTDNYPFAIYGNYFKFCNTTFKNSTFSKFIILFEFTTTGSQVDNCTFYKLDYGTSGSGRYGFVVFARRCDVRMNNCNFTNVHLTQTGTGERALISHGFGKLNMTNTIVENCSINGDSPGDYALIGWTSSSYAYIYNCTFKNNNHRNNQIIRANPMSDIINCTFENNNKGITLVGDGVNIINSTFTGNKEVIQGDYEFTTVDNCTFKSNNPSNAVIDINGNKTIIKNCTFDEDDNITCIDLHGMNGNLINNTKDIKINGTVKGFTSYSEIYVSPNGESLDSIHYWTNLNNALSSIDLNGKIYISPGVYSLENTTNVKVSASIIGLKKGNVFINNISFDTSSIINNEIVNITFNNTLSSFTIAMGSTFNNCIFTNISDLNFGKDVPFFSIINSEIDNVNTTNSLTSSSDRNVHNTFENLTFIKFKGFISGSGTFVHNLFKNITIDNSQFYGFQRSAPNEFANNRFIDINITNCERTTSNYFIRLNDNYLSDYMVETNRVENILIENITNTVSGIFITSRGIIINKLTIKNITNSQSNVLISSGTVPVLSNITFSLIDSTNSLFSFGNGVAYSIDGLTIDNVNATGIIPAVNDVELNRLVINKVNITSNVLLTLKDNNILRNSNFTDYVGHIVVDGDNVEILDSNFTRGNNSDLNGSSIYLNSGSDMLKVINCRFNKNNASNGTIYVSDNCKRPVFSSCIFTDNIAKYQGGALYIVSTNSSKVTAGIDSVTNDTISYPGESGYIKGYNDFYGYLEDTFTVLYLVNDTTNWHPEPGKNYDGHTYMTATDDLSKLYNLIDGASVIFVRYGDVFTPSSTHMVYDTDFESITFYGNNTTFIDMGINIKNNNMKIFNFTLKNFPNTGITVNANDCLFDNCSFVNVGGDAAQYGGAMLINGNNTVITNSRFINCNATHQTEGSDDGLGGALFINKSNTKVNNCHFEYNTVSNDGSHVYINKGLNNVTLLNNNFTFGNIMGSGHGSGVVVQGTNINVDGNKFNNNTGQVGSAMSVIGDVFFLTVTNNNFTDNTAIINGAALYLGFTNSFGQSNVIADNDFVNNSAVNGGALFVDVSDLNAFTMNNNDYINNSATFGGAVYINCPGFVLSDGILKNNSATLGGAVYVNATNVLFKNLNLTYNNALKEDSMGSAIYVAHNVDCNFENVRLNHNRVYGGDDPSTSGGLRGDIYFADIVSASIDNIIFGSEPYVQYYVVNTMYRGMTIYVNVTGSGRGLSVTDTRSNLSTALQHIAVNGTIYFMDDSVFEITVDLYNQIRETNLTNVTFVGVGNKIIKKSNDNQNKYLFILEVFKQKHQFLHEQILISSLFFNDYKQYHNII